MSAAAVWEIVTKKSLSKLNIPYDLEKALEDSRFFTLAVTSAHALAVENLEDHHQDPFDRIQVAQAKSEGLMIVTRDDNIKKYDISFISA